MIPARQHSRIFDRKMLKIVKVSGFLVGYTIGIFIAIFLFVGATRVSEILFPSEIMAKMYMIKATHSAKSIQQHEDTK